MLTPSLVTPIMPLYPIGNTPAISLARDLPQGVDADILLLGCDDVRHILFTAYSEQGFPSRKLDITCCDVQDHIVARNVLLLSFLCAEEDGTPSDVLWNVYYHKYLAEADTQVVQSQARKLLEFITSLEEWHASRYGKVLRFCDQRTLDCARSVWKSYDTSVSVKNTKFYQDKFRSAMKKSNEHKGMTHGPGSAVYTVARFAAPVYMSMADDVQTAVGDMWEQDVAGPTTPGQYPNPLFASALSDSATLAFPSNPLLSFHLATAGVNLTELSPLRPNSSASEASPISKLLGAAKIQFAEWLKAFKKLSTTITVRFVAADCFAFCQSLQHNVTTGETCANLYRRQLDSRPLVLDEAAYVKEPTAPRQFDAIDTSNLSDQLGTLNLLVSAGPLLKDRPWSTLYAELMARGTVADQQKFEALLCGRTKTLSMPLGLAPVEYWTNATAVSYLDEIYLALGERAANEETGKPGGPKTQYRLAWKLDSHLSGGAPPTLSMDPQKLANVLLKVYLEMFAGENPALLMSGLTDPKAKVAATAYPAYRGSFVALVKAVCSRVDTDANEVARLLIQMISADHSLMFGSNYGHELALEMAMSGLFADPWLKREIKQVPSRGTFCKWKDIPEAVAVTLVVPASRWKPLFKEAAEKGIGLTMEGHLLQPGAWHNMYANVQLTFGTVSASGSRDSDDYSVSVQEDAKGVLGDSPLVASFYAAAAAVQIDMATSTVALGLQHTAQNVMLFAQTLGHNMHIFDTKLSNGQNVHITKHLPGQKAWPVVGSLGRLASTGSRHDSNTTLTPEVDDTTGKISTITGRANITSNHDKGRLRSQTPIVIEQTSPFTIDVLFAEGEQRTVAETITYRVPVTTQNSKTRIARKSSYVEVVVKLAEPSVSPVLDTFIYPVINHPGPSPGTLIPTTLNIPHLSLDTLPIISLDDKKSLHFLRSLASFTFSDRELRLREEAEKAGLQTLPTVRMNFKETIFTMLMAASGLQLEQSGLFAIVLPDTGINILFFVSALRLDGANGNVVLDAAVIPLTPELLEDEEFMEFGLIVRGCNPVQLPIDDKELVLWKKILPALAERCRTWSHGPKCEYVKHGTYVPILCSCGNGKVPDQFVALPGWEESGRKFATRVAISPTFAVPFVEEVVDRNFAEAFGKTGQVERCRACGKTEGKGGEELKRCARCLGVKYCSGECQRRDWKGHKVECKETEGGK